MHPLQRHRALNHSGRVPRVVRGYVLLPVVLAMTLVAAIAFLLNSKSPMQVYQVDSQRQTDQVRYITEAGLNHALWQTQQSGCGPYSDNTNQGFGNDTYTTTLTTDLGGTNSHTLSVDQDTWIRSDQPTVNKATDGKLHIRYEGGTIERPMYRYDLSPLSANANILSATAWFYISKEHPEGPLDIHRLITGWIETDATWDTMGDNMDSAVLATIPTQPNQDVWVSVNLTAQVQAWVNGQANYGITLNSNSEGTHGDYASRETGQQPYLEVIVGTPPSSPATLQSVGTLTNGVSRSITRNDVMLSQQPAGTRTLQPHAAQGIDAYIWAAQKFNNYGGDDETWAATGNNNTALALFRFDLAAVPQRAKILGATLSLYHREGNDPDVPVTAHRITNPWHEDYVTWYDRDSGTSWDTAGGDFDASFVATTLVGPASTTRYEWDLSALVQGWIDGSYANHGVVLRTVEPGIFGERFDTSDHSDPTRRPRLTVNYACACGSPCLAPQGWGKVLMVVGNPSNLTTDDKLAQAHIEDWGYTVSFIQDGDSQGNFDAAVASNDVVFVARSAHSSNVGTKLTNAPKGIVSEKGALVDELGIANDTNKPVGRDVQIVDTTHYITQNFSTGSLPIYTVDMEARTITGPAPGLQILAERNGAGALVVLDQGAQAYGGGTASSRRVMLPFIPSSSFNPAYINNNGWLIAQRALQWASGNTGPVVNDPIVLSTDSPATLGGLGFDDIDLAEYDPLGDSATLFFAGAPTTLDSDIDALHVLANDHILLSTKDADNLGGLSFADGDLVEYDPATDSASLYFDESAFSADEDIVSVYIMDNDHILLSTDSDATLGGLSFTDNDLVEYDPASGTATLYFDGSTVSLSEDIDAVHLLDNGHIVLSTKDDTSLGGLSFKDGDLVDYDPATDTASLYFAEALFEGGEDVISTHIGPGSGGTPQGPIAHWKLDETSGPTAVDSEGGHDGTLSNGPTWGAGQLDGALDFDGTNDLVDMGSDATLDDIFAGGATVSAWIYPKGWGESDFGRIFDKADNLGSNRNGWAYELYGSNQSILFQYGFSGNIGNWVTPANSISLNTWQHVAVVYDNSSDANDPVLYINGVAQTLSEIDTPSGTPSSDAALNLTLGNYALATSRTFDGLLDDVRIYDRMLDATEIAELANAGDTGPIAHWKLDETSGATAVDSAGGHDGALAGNPTWSTGTLDGALDFDGSGDRIDVGSILDGGSPQISVTAWIFKRDTGDDRVISKSSGTAIPDHIFSLGLYGTTIRARLRTTDNGGTSDYDGGAISLDQWVHVAFTYDGAQLRIYKDGTETASYAVTGDMIASTQDIAIGNVNATDDRYWNGLLDDVRIYDTALSASEVAELANPDAVTGPIAHWKLDETAGATAVDSEGGHNGTLVGDLNWGSGQVDGALMFDGLDDRVNVPHDDNLSLTDAFTLSAWTNSYTLSGYDLVLNKGTSGNNQNYWFGTLDDEITFGFYTGTWREFNTSGLNLQQNTWYHIAATFDDASDEVRLYLDGSEVLSTSTTVSPTPNTEDLQIGRSQHGEYWGGKLDDIRIYDRVLDLSEIAVLAAGGGGGGGPPPGGCNGTFRDVFNTIGFSNNDGSLNWIAGWQEVGESDGATSGDVRVMNDQSNYQLRIQDNQNGGEGVAREANLTGAASATLTFDYRRQGLDNANDHVQVAVSASGTGGPWTELDLIAGSGTDSNYQSASYNISAQTSANTAIRLRSSSNMGNNDRVFFDNIQIQCVP